MLTKREYEQRRMERVHSDPEYGDRYRARKRAAQKKARPGYEAQRKAAWRAKNPDKARLLRKAHHIVEEALKYGRLTKPTACQHCSAETRLEAHHHKGYAKEHWLDVEWLCELCHGTADRKQKADLNPVQEKGKE